MILVPTTSLDDWKRLLANRETQWKPGYSAHALADRWQNAQVFPAEVQTLLNSDDRTAAYKCEIVEASP